MSESEPNPGNARPGQSTNWPIATARRDGVGAERWDQVVMAAYRTVRLLDDVPAAYVVLPRRPTYEELAHVRAQVCSHDIRLTVSGQHDVSIRTQAAIARTPAPAEASSTVQPVQIPRRSWLHRHRPGWLQHLLTMTEGVR